MTRPCNCDSSNPYIGPWHAIGCCTLYAPIAVREEERKDWRTRRGDEECGAHHQPLKLCAESEPDFCYVVRSEDEKEEDCNCRTGMEIMLGHRDDCPKQKIYGRTAKGEK